MENGAESFRERNRKRREQNAFENLYAYARRAGISDPKKTTERAVRRLHGDGVVRSDPEPEARASQEREEQPVPRRLEDRTKEQLYARAQELEIEGRSQMSKEELIEAIRGK
jgi:hypothetical protein